MSVEFGSLANKTMYDFSGPTIGKYKVKSYEVKTALPTYKCAAYQRNYSKGLRNP